jgi:hypothetical protein
MALAKAMGEAVRVRAGLAILGVSLLLGAYWIGGVSRREDPSSLPPISAAVARHPVPPPSMTAKRGPDGGDGGASPAEHVPRVLPSASNAAAQAAFHEAQRCYFTASKIAIWKRMADCGPMNGRPGLELQYAACLNRVVDHQDRIREAHSRMVSCGDEKTLARRYYEATKSAAKNGDLEAQLCYVSGSFADPDGMTHYTDEDLAEYRATAPAYVDAALERGDWRMAGVLARHFVDGFDLSRLLDRIGEPATIYKMDALLRLGAVGDYADTLASAMQDIAHPDLNPDLALSAASIAAAEDWARAAYARSFSGSPPLHEAPAGCGADNDPEN